MLNCKRDQFNLPGEISYLNCAYFSPLLKTVEKVGHTAVSMKNTPHRIGINDFFEPVDKLKQFFARLIDVEEFQRIATVPGVSYGMANVVNNISLHRGDQIMVCAEQFPSNIYPWQEKAKQVGAEIVTVLHGQTERGKSWNSNILEGINKKTKVVALPIVHWTDGTLFNMKLIREKCDEVGAYLVIDGSQSIGALPFSVKEIKPDALICAGYKWLLGPYSLGLAYYNERFDNGVPIEPCWINKEASEDFQNLANYREDYKPFANRYAVSESSNFILVPMLAKAIEQLLEWTPERIQQYCNSISSEFISEILNLGGEIEEEPYRAHHLFGIRLSDHFDLQKVKKALKQNHVYVSFRGSAMRVAPHLYNSEDDFRKLLACIKEGSK